MDTILEKIKEMEDTQLQQVIRAVEQRYRQVYPEWDVVFVSVHKDPKLRAQEFRDLLLAMEKDIQWHRENMEK